MNRTARILLFVLAATLVAGLAGAAVVNTSSFAVTLPDAYSAPVKSSAMKDNITTDTWLSKAPTGEAVVVSVSTMPAKIADPVKLMDSTRDSLIKSVNGTLESEQPLAADMPSRRLVFSSNGKAFLRSRLVVNGDRLYQLLYVGRSEQERNAPAVAALFDSFKVNAAAPVATTTPPQPK